MTDQKKIKNGEIKGLNYLTTAEIKIGQNIYQVKANKKIIYFTSQVNHQTLKSLNLFQINDLKKELLEFINNSNIYYSQQKEAAENLLIQLENYLVNDGQNSSGTKPENFPWKVVFAFSLLVGISLLTALVIRAKKNVKKKIK